MPLRPTASPSRYSIHVACLLNTLSIYGHLKQALASCRQARIQLKKVSHRIKPD